MERLSMTPVNALNHRLLSIYKALELWIKSTHKPPFNFNQLNNQTIHIHHD